MNSPGEKIMAEQILVPLKRNDRVEEIIPYIEESLDPACGSFSSPPIPWIVL